VADHAEPVINLAFREASRPNGKAIERVLGLRVNTAERLDRDGWLTAYIMEKWTTDE